ncbi:MAG: SDR family oxidoreductase [Bacteroidales bacterium]|nr:MAG: SDR family oxidoreductase [Bacteroidales bacterium]
MKIFVTGATGFLGINLCNELVSRGHIVNALYRSERKAKYIKHKNIHLFKGDITDTESIENAITGCDYVFHLAAYAQVWSKKSDTFHKINYTGTLKVLDAAEREGVKKVIITSTAGVFGPSNNNIIDENSRREVGYFTLYEKTKAEAEDLVLKRAAGGLNVVIVNPTRVYGPGLMNASNSVTRMIKLYIKGKFRSLPGNGKSIGNYVFIDDVVNGHILALEKGIAGEKYILGGENVSYIDFFKVLSEISKKKYLLFKFPLYLMLIISFFMLLIARVFGVKPLITPGWVRKYNYNWILSSDKAMKNLGYVITPLRAGIARTLDFIKSENR